MAINIAFCVVMANPFRLVLGLLLLLGCADSRRGGSGDPTFDSTAAGSGVVENSGGSVPRTDPEIGTEDCEPGEKREATKEESGNYCVCVEDSGLRWRCFGPDPEDSSIGSTKAACGNIYGHAGKESCLVQWSCDDGHLYSIVCIEGSCVCMVGNKSTAELEPMSSCPEELNDINELCGWELTRRQ